MDTDYAPESESANRLKPWGRARWPSSAKRSALPIDVGAGGAGDLSAML
jgi:hypothetical protein